MKSLFESIKKAEKNTFECDKKDINCQLQKYFQSIVDDLSIPSSISCNFSTLKKDPQGHSYSRGSCFDYGVQKECITFPKSALNSLCYTKCNKSGKKLNRAVCYRKDIICQCKD